MVDDPRMNISTWSDAACLGLLDGGQLVHCRVGKDLGRIERGRRLEAIGFVFLEEDDDGWIATRTAKGSRMIAASMNANAPKVSDKIRSH